MLWPVILVVLCGPVADMATQELDDRRARNEILIARVHEEGMRTHTWARRPIVEPPGCENRPGVLPKFSIVLEWEPELIERTSLTEAAEAKGLPIWLPAKVLCRPIVLDAIERSAVNHDGSGA